MTAFGNGVVRGVFGGFADIVGRKPLMLLGIALFLVTSVLCGAACSMLSLIVFRALQAWARGPCSRSTSWPW